MPSSCHAETASSSSSTLLESELSMEAGLEDRVRHLISSYNLSAQRNREPHEDEEENLKKFHSELKSLIKEERNLRRRKNLLALLSTSNCFREQLLFLRKYQNSTGILSASTYFSVMHSELTFVMNKSFEEEYRKLADFLGFPETLAEVLVCDVDTFGLQPSQENIAVRKLVANALTNFTYGDLQRKRRLCSYPDFVKYVVKIIDKIQVLAQVYAALLRNMSWNADSEMNTQLCLTVPVLAQASLRAYNDKDLKCLCSTLSALWNLSFSKQNQRALCEFPAFLEMLVDLLVDDLQQTALVESATGVLKYASLSFSIVNVNDYVSAGVLHKMVLRLVDLLRSSSFTTITNCLCVLLQLLKYDYQLRAQLKVNAKAMQTLHCLRDSKHREVNNAIRTILDHLNETDSSCFSSGLFESAHTSGASSYAPNGMISSYNGIRIPAPSFFDSSRLLKIRSMQSDMSNLYPGATDSINSRLFNYQAPLSMPTAPYGFAPRPGAVPHQFNSLPRQCYQNNNIPDDGVPCVDTNRFGQQLKVMSFESGGDPSASGRRMDVVDSSFSQQSTTMITDVDDNDFNASDTDLCGLNEVNDPSFEVEESVRCTRGSSTQSLSSLLPGEKSGWNSYNNSAVNSSNRLSPVSASELPDSPTQCSTLKNKEQLQNQAMELNAQPGCSSFEHEVTDCLSDSTEKVFQTTYGLGALSLSVEDNDPIAQNIKPVGDEESLHSRQSSVNEEFDYGSFSGVADSELLNQSIEAVMPKRAEVNDDFLSDMIEQAQPKPSRLRKAYNEVHNFSSASTTRMHSDSSSMRTDEDDFLQQSINNVLPQSSPSRRNVLPVLGSFKKRIF